MMDRAGENNAHKNLFLTALGLLLVIAGGDCDKTSLFKLTAGDVVNDINFDQLTSDHAGDLFSSETASKYVESTTLDYVRSHAYVTQFECNDMSKSGFYPDIDAEGSKKVDFDYGKLTASMLGIDQRYVGDYTCISLRECTVKAEEYVSIDLKSGNDYPEEVKQQIVQSGLSKSWREDETSYVSYIMKGDCVFQVLVFEGQPSESFKYWENIPLHVGKISSASHNATLENWTAELLTRTGRSLGNIDVMDKENLYRQLNNAAVIKMRLKLLPKFSSN